MPNDSPGVIRTDSRCAVVGCDRLHVIRDSNPCAHSPPLEMCSTQGPALRISPQLMRIFPDACRRS
jgi:hypothetical protein